MSYHVSEFFLFLNRKRNRNTCVKTDFCNKLDSFLCDLTDLTYKMLGLTVIYVPAVNRELTIEEASDDKELVKRMESVMAHWNTQIKIALSDQEQATPHELLCLDDEYDFWTYRCECLLLRGGKENLVVTVFVV